MTKKQFLHLLKDAPGDALILVPDSGDRCYRAASPDVTTVLFNGEAFTEDLGEDLTPESQFGKRIPVIIIA